MIFFVYSIISSTLLNINFGRKTELQFSEETFKHPSLFDDSVTTGSIERKKASKDFCLKAIDIKFCLSKTLPQQQHHHLTIMNVK